ncbi:sugar ABC transporter substrate-binding protein [Bacillus sp. V3-13]|uniref:substrate-binding domain-containing protein n=1 Tax=Bacillus sp. V3-13 TaxID=2053728 RepID=UPI000C792E9F|nr:substrate-binding domain-containing protein [Bacillus sp. V3-13]PLR76554.1 sugar ABC transporter substrate-binding protein [Bacillus sp. V3-13]
MKKIFLFLLMILLISSIALVGCSQGNTETAGGSEDLTPEEAADSSGPITINQDIPDQEILSKGPDGESAISAKTLQLTEEEVEEIKAGDYTAAIVMHYAGNDWATAQIAGLEATFKRMGIEVVAVTDAQFKAEKQVSDIETVLAKSPDIIVGIPVDPVSTAGAFKKAAEAGVKIVFMDNKPEGLKAGEDYVSVVSADNYGNGIAAADIMAEELGENGEIGVIFHDADYFVTKQRTEAFEATIKEKYPDIKIVERGGITGPNDGEKVASGMLTKNSNLDGMFVVWDVPAEGALAAARNAGKNDLVITTIDLGTTVALDIASGGSIKGIGAQLPYDQGISEAILAGYGLLEKEAPAYVAVPSLKVTKENVLDSWKLVYHKDAPETIQNAAK